MDTGSKNGSDRDVSISVPSKRSPYDFPTSVDVDAAASVAMALGHRLRMQILCRVAPFRGRGLSAGTLSAELMVVPSSLSHHLQQMTRAGALDVRHQGRSMFYSVNHNGIAVLRDFLSTLIDDKACSGPALRTSEATEEMMTCDE